MSEDILNVAGHRPLLAVFGIGQLPAGLPYRLHGNPPIIDVRIGDVDIEESPGVIGPVRSYIFESRVSHDRKTMTVP